MVRATAAPDEAGIREGTPRTGATGVGLPEFTRMRWGRVLRSIGQAEDGGQLT